MIKHILGLIIFSVLVLLFMPQAQIALHALLDLHTLIAETLTQIFSGGKAGDLTRQLLALLCVPVIIGLVPAILYYFVRRHWFPYFMEWVWFAWLMQTTALVMQYHTAVV